MFHLPARRFTLPLSSKQRIDGMQKFLESIFGICLMSIRVYLVASHMRL
jgi:hypothetical protein